MGHDELDGPAHVSGLRVAHLALLGADYRASGLPEELEERELASAVEEQGLSVEYFNGQEPVVEVLTQSQVFIIDLRH